MGWKLKKLTGFTIIELLVISLILSFIIIGITGVLNIGNLSYSTDGALLELQQQARLSMQWMVKELRGATGISINSDKTQITFDTSTEANVRYYRDTTSNRVMRAATATKILGNDMTSLTFCCWHSDNTCDYNCSGVSVLQVKVGADKTVMNKQLSFYLTEKVNLRN